MGYQKRVKAHLMKIPGKRKKVMRRAHLRKVRRDIKKKGKGR